MFGFSSLAPTTPAIIASLAELAPQTLAVMHGSSFTGDGRAALGALADDYVRRLGDPAPAAR